MIIWKQREQRWEEFTTDSKMKTVSRRYEIDRQIQRKSV